MKVHFRAEFARDWVLTREATMGGSPITHLRECIQNIIGSEGRIKTLDSGYTDCNLMLFMDKSAFSNFEVQLWQTLEDEFQIGKGSREAAIRYEKILEAEEVEEAKMAEMLAAIKPKVDSLLGVQPYKDLLEEVRLISSQIMTLSTQRVFNSRAYLFVVDEGCGLTTYLEIFANLAGSLGLFEFSAEHKVVETVVEYNDKDPWLQYNAIGKFKNSLICFDICQWISHMDEPGFKKFLRKLRHLQKDYIYVFRVNNMDDQVLARVYQTISDAIYTEQVIFPPFTYKEYFSYVAGPLSMYQFTVSEDAKDEFNKKVLEEKSKGDFYGLRTIRKIAYEMMYRKIIKNAKEGVVDMVIHGSDLAGWAD